MGRWSRRRSWRRNLLLLKVFAGLILFAAAVQLFLFLVENWWIPLTVAALAGGGYAAWRWLATTGATAELSASVTQARSPPPEARERTDFDAGRTVPTVRGEFVRSPGEARIANFLFNKGIRYEYEPYICGFRPDFYLPDYRVIIEYWGITHNLEYDERRYRKTAAYRAAGFALINLESVDYSRLEDVLMRKLYRFEKRIYHDARGIPPG